MFVKIGKNDNNIVKIKRRGINYYYYYSGQKFYILTSDYDTDYINDDTTLRHHYYIYDTEDEDNFTFACERDEIPFSRYRRM